MMIIVDITRLTLVMHTMLKGCNDDSWHERGYHHDGHRDHHGHELLRDHRGRTQAQRFKFSGNLIITTRSMKTMMTPLLELVKTST